MLSGVVSLRSGATLFSRVGSWPTLAIAAACLLAGQLRSRLPRRRRDGPDEGPEAAAPGLD